jgi:hypothetical protein
MSVMHSRDEMTFLTRLLPSTEAVRDRLAEIARERALLRSLLRLAKQAEEFQTDSRQFEVAVNA